MSHKERGLKYLQDLVTPSIKLDIPLIDPTII